ncbi:hypothetical protein R50073_33230 [Maricurvus nonylphenolicus]|uniref:hypothetical protein n=1 Tax=Maricurvus nonylphenolicus TaxID=1008307 RepID=UPI0036F3FDFF
MAKSRAKQKDVEAPVKGNGGDPESRLRDIQNLLFGEQQSHLEDVIAEFRAASDFRFNQLEKQLHDTVKELKKELEKHVRTLNKRIDSDGDKQSNRSACIEGELGDLDSRLEQFKAETESAHQAAENQLFAELRQLTEAMNEHFAALENSVQENTDELRHSKTDRSALSTLLKQMAQQIDDL